MLDALKLILEIQELDMKMIRLMRLKREREQDLDKLQSVKGDLNSQADLKEAEIADMKKAIRLLEGEHQEVLAKLKKLESQQTSIKKVEEFNALSQEMSQMERERVAREQRLSDFYDKLALEEDALKVIRESLASTVENSRALEDEINASIEEINKEGRGIKQERDVLAKSADQDVLKIYDRLLKNKRDRVVVAIENRCCSGCHIMLTAQDENLVRKGERIIFCEHCSRIHYWPESQSLEGTAIAPRQRRRRVAAAS